MDERLLQIALWPRLLAVAADSPILLKESLETLWNAGVALKINDTGGLQLTSGNLANAAWDDVKRKYLESQRPSIVDALRRARSMAHPWLPSIRAAFQDLSLRIQRQTEAIRPSVEAHDWPAIFTAATQLAERYVQAVTVAEVLWNAGDASYKEPTERYRAAWHDLAGTLEHYGKEPEFVAHPWPVQTPDVWIWITVEDWPAPVTIDLGGETGRKEPQEEEPVFQPDELARSLRPVDLIAQEVAENTA